MARARNIKPGFFTNDLLAEIDPLGRLLFAGIWTIADRSGRLLDRPKKIKAEVLPFDNCDVEALLSDLTKHGFIIRYEVDGCRYIQVANWCKHQNPHIKEAQSTIPAPDSHSADTVQALDKTLPLPERAGLIPDSLNLIPCSLSEQTTSTANTPPVDKSPPPSSSSKSSPSAEKRKASAKQRIAWLRDKERSRQGIEVKVGSESDPRLLGMIDAGVTDEVFEEAYRLAKQQRADQGDAGPINIGYLESVVARILGEANKPPKRSAVMAVAAHWFDTATGIEAKGEELGVEPARPETGGFPAFKARVFKAAGIAMEVVA